MQDGILHLAETSVDIYTLQTMYLLEHSQNPPMQLLTCKKLQMATFTLSYPP